MARDVSLTPIEKVLLAKSIDWAPNRRRMVRVLLIGFAALVLMVTVRFSDSLHRESIFFWTLVAYVVVTTWDKLSHDMVIIVYKRLVQKLVTRLVRAEGLGDEWGGGGLPEPDGAVAKPREADAESDAKPDAEPGGGRDGGPTP